jgi:flavodoxin I
MSALVVYDTSFGNTEQIAKDIASAIAGGAIARPMRDVDPERLPASDLLVIGSPTQGGRPTRSMQAWLDRLPIDALENRRCAAFDTRIVIAEQGFALRTLMRVIGFAAPRIAKSLLAKRGILAAEPEGFLVEGREGPLRSGERERAAKWAAALV